MALTTQQKQQIRELAAQGKNYQEIEQLVCAKYEQIKFLAKTEGFTVSKSYTSVVSQELIEDSKTMTVSELSTKHGVAPGTIRGYFKRRNLPLLTEVQRIDQQVWDRVVRDRLNGMTVEDLSTKYGIEERTITSHFYRNSVTVKEGPTESQKALISSLRETTTSTIAEIAETTGRTVGSIKKVLLKAGISIPMEQRQENAYRAKLAKNPDAMVDMRKSLTPEVVEKRSEAVQHRYSSDPELAKRASERALNYFAQNPKQSKYVWADFAQAAQAVNMTILSEENSWKNKDLSVRCHCGVEFQVAPYDFLYGKIKSCGCVKSHEEKRLLKMIQEWGFEEAHTTRQIIPPLEIDVFIPSLKLGIEYCGLWAHGEGLNGLSARTKHKEKMIKCLNAGVRLLTIFSDEWFSRNSQVVNYLRSVLGLNNESVGARECQTITDRDALVDFIENNHVIPFSGHGCDTIVGLKHQENIVAAMAFRGEEMVRYCLGPKKVLGGFEKLLGEFRRLNPNILNIYTFSDNRWSSGKMYERHGFEKIKEIPPSYWYTKHDTKRFHKSNFRKKKIASSLGLYPNETEWEAMQRHGFDRVWDCGLVKWRLSF